MHIEGGNGVPLAQFGDKSANVACDDEATKVPAPNRTPLHCRDHESSTECKRRLLLDLLCTPPEGGSGLPAAGTAGGVKLDEECDLGVLEHIAWVRMSELRDRIAEIEAALRGVDTRPACHGGPAALPEAATPPRKAPATNSTGPTATAPLKAAAPPYNVGMVPGSAPAATSAPGGLSPSVADSGPGPSPAVVAAAAAAMVVTDVPYEVLGVVFGMLDTVSMFNLRSASKHFSLAFAQTVGVAALSFNARKYDALPDIRRWNEDGSLEERTKRAAVVGRWSPESVFWALNAVSRCTYLREVHAEGLAVTDRALWSLVQCQYLTSLNLRGCTDISASGLSVVLGQLTQLRELDISGCSLTDGVFKDLSASHRLRSVCVRDCHLTNVSLAMLARCPLLEAVDLWVQPIRGVYRVGDPGLASLAACANLRVVRVGWSTVTDVGVTALAQGCPLLDELDLSHSQVGVEGLRALGEHCRRLRRLTMFECRRVNDDCADALAALAALEDLAVGCTNVSDKALSRIGGLGRLRSLDLSACDISDAGLAAVAGCPGLMSLSIIGVQGITDGGLRVLLDRLPLRYLSVALCGRLTDESLCRLPQCTTLQWLELGPNVSFAALWNLSNCPRLNAVYCMESSCHQRWTSDDARHHLESHGIDFVRQVSALCTCGEVWS